MHKTFNSPTDSGIFTTSESGAALGFEKRLSSIKIFMDVGTKICSKRLLLVRTSR